MTCLCCLRDLLQPAETQLGRATSGVISGMYSGVAQWHCMQDMLTLMGQVQIAVIAPTQLQQ